MIPFKVCFLQTEWKNEDVLNQYRKMTPGNKGVWKEMTGVTSIDDADYVAIIDYTVQDIKNKPAIYLGAHPPSTNGYRCFDNAKNAIARMDLRDTCGFGEWWLEMDYDTLMALRPTQKTRNLSAIVSSKTITEGHRQKIKFVDNFCIKYKDKIDIYGRVLPKQIPHAGASYKGPLGFVDGVNPEFKSSFNVGKIPALSPYRYTLDFDIDQSCPYYFSERFYDDLLLWCMPIYSGGTQVHKFLPENSFRYFDREKTTPEEILDIVNSDFREKHINDMWAARELLLDTYQLWPRVYNSIKRIQ